MKNQTLLYLSDYSPQELAKSLEELLHGYLCYAFQECMTYQEAMGNYENVYALIKALQNQTDDDHSPNQTAA